MDVRPGYKQTDVGIIPEAWEVKRLGEVGEALIGLTYKPTDVRSQGTLVLRSSNIQNDSLSFDDNVFVDKDIPERIRVRHGDVLVCVRNGSRALIGKSALLDNRVEGMTFGAFMAVYRSPLGRLSNFLFQSEILKRQIREHLGATINQITNKSLNSFLIPLPPTKAEREAITEALSDVDAYIGSLEQVIAKKRLIKQGAMQDLLTGKRRLPGFNGGWEVKQLREIADIRSGGTPSTTEAKYWGGSIPWCTPTDITGLNGKKYLNKTHRRITEEGLRASSAEMIPSNSIVMTSRATIGECAINTIPVSTNQGFKNLIPFNFIDTDFLYYLLATQKRGLISLCAGSTFLEIGKTQLQNYEVRLPVRTNEQTAIAETLNDMDAEVEALEEKLKKAQQLKQGMMQELLTGRIRLI